MGTVHGNILIHLENEFQLAQEKAQTEGSTAAQHQQNLHCKNLHCETRTRGIISVPSFIHHWEKRP